MKMSLVRRYACFVFLMLSGICPFPLYAQMSFGSDSSRTTVQASDVRKESLLGIPTTFGEAGSAIFKKVDASADMYEYVGDNMIARGHVVIKSGPLTITANKAIINVNSQDIEATGNVTFTRMVTETRQISYETYLELLDDPAMHVKILKYVTTPLGLKQLEVSVEYIGNYMKADRIAGNLGTGLLQFKDFAIKTGAMYVAATHAERNEDGRIQVENARLTTCNYIMDDHDHYAFTASEATLYPRKYNSGVKNYNPDHGEHSIAVYNPLLRLWDVPVLWFPMLYKPYETDSFGVDFDFGASSDWGYFVRTSKPFNLIDTKKLNVTAAALFDYYSDRGIGAGAKTTILTEESKTEIFAYGMHDRDPYSQWGASNSATKHWYEQFSRLEIPNTRYDVKITNLTHLTPSLDFRGQFELLSDYNFLYDYFDQRYQRDIQPPTYASLEYQMDRLSLAVLTTVRVNSFDTTLQRLPEAYLNLPRQELFGGLYYQSETTGGYMDMRWREFDKPSVWGLGNVSNYSSGRFDTLHMFYYPFNLSFLNIIPRAGVRLTGYTASSSEKVSDDDLQEMFNASSISINPAYSSFQNFDTNGGGKLRFLAEFGLEANTKIYRSWQDVRNGFWELDGLRHVAMPYINYTYIPKPTTDYENLLYFDDIDRIKEQHFIRFGLTNRLQTRAGNFGSERIREWISLDTYWDFHMIEQNGFNHIGDLGAKLSFTPFDDLTLTSELIWDIGENNPHETEASRGTRLAGRPGLSKLKYIDKWNTTLTYKISKDWKVYASYMYSDYYRQRGVYSMGSMIERLNASSTTVAAYFPRSQMATVGVNFPTYLDPRMTAGVEMTYDVDAALLNNACVRVARDFHCWKAGVELGTSVTRDSDQDKEYSNYISFFLSLSTMPSVGLGHKVSVD